MVLYGAVVCTMTQVAEVVAEELCEQQLLETQVCPPDSWWSVDGAAAAVILYGGHNYNI